MPIPSFHTSSKAVHMLLLACALCVAATFAAAEEYKGKIDAVEAKADGLRFFVKNPGLHLYATGQYRDLLLPGFFQKATFSIGYQAFPCPGGLAGRCLSLDGSVDR